jgi:UPF0716 protein FxsA
MEPIVLARLLLLFILVPMAELALLLVIADYTDWLFTLGLIIFTGVVGAWLARREGTQCLSRIQAELSQGQLPGDSLVDGLMILVAGAVLITPGVLTDILGFSLLVPPIRARLKQLVIARFKHRIVVSGFSSGAPGGGDVSDVIDVEHGPTKPPRSG